MNITFGNADTKYVLKQLCEIRQGDLFINAYQDPDRLIDNVGVYVAINSADWMSRPENKDSPFVMNLRSGTTYSFRYMEKRLAKNHRKNMVYMANASLSVNIQRA